MAAAPQHLGFLVADIARLMRRAFRQRQQHATLTLAQARALVHLSRCDGVRQVDLAESLEVQPITLARVIDQLEAAKLVERRTDPTDRRACLVHLKRAAQPYLHAIEAVAQSIRGDALRGFDARESARVLEALARVHANLSSLDHDISRKQDNGSRKNGDAFACSAIEGTRTRRGRAIPAVSPTSSRRRARSSDRP